MAINTHKDGHLEYITSSDGTKHYLNAEYLDGHSYDDISSSIDAKADNHRHFKSGDSQRNNGVYTYYKLASFPIDNSGNSCSLTVDGRIGGWNKGNKGYLSMIISNQDGISATGTLIGNAQLNDLCDLVVYTSGATSANSTATLYVKTYSWFAFDLTLGAMSGVEDIYDGNGVKTTPAGTLAWALSQNLNKFLQVRDDGDILKQGHSVALKSEIPSIANKGATLDWGTSKTIATIGSTDITAKLPSNPNTDTHFTTGLYVGKVDEKNNAATTNGNTYLKLFDNDTKRAQHLINGSGATTVTSNAGGTITVATPIKNLDTTSSSKVGDGSSENIAGSGTIYLHKVAKTGSYTDLVNRPTIPTNFVTIDTEQRISGKKYFENDVNFGKWVNPIRQVSDAPANLNLMSSAQTNAGFFDTVMFAGAGDWLYLGHLKPDFSIRASFKGNGEESDTYSASLGYTHGYLDYLTDWDYQYGWFVRPTKVSATTPAIIQIKFTKMLYTDVLRLILTGHNLDDSGSGSAYSGFLDDYTIEVCTDYAKDTWTTVVNRTNASDNIGKGLMYSLQTGSYTECYGIRLKITKCHVTGTGYAFIKISSMQLRDYRPGIKFPDCLGAISQSGGDVWGQLNTKNNLQTHTIVPEDASTYYIGTGAKPYYGIYANDFYERGTPLSDKYLAKGSASTVVNQVVYNPVEMKKALKVPSIRGENSGNNHMNGAPLYSLGSTMATENGQATGSSSLELTGYTGATGNPRYTTIAQRASGDFVISPASGRGSKDLCFSDSSAKWTIAGSPILTESSLSTQQWTLTDVNGNGITVNICVK